MTRSKTSLAAKGFKKAKPKSIAYYKDKLWKLVSIFIRRRDADPNGYVQCCTCLKWKHWKEGDAGHFIDGRRNAIVYDIRNIHFQCKPCNGSFVNQSIDRHEIKNRYTEFMVKRYGAEVVRELQKRNKELKQWTVAELQALIEDFKAKVEALNES